MSGFSKAIATVAGIVALIPSPIQSIAAAIAVSATMVAQATAKRPTSNRQGMQLSFKIDPNSPVYYPIGRTAVGGVVVHRETYGPDNQMQTYFVDLGLGPVHAIETFLADRTPVDFSGSSAVGYYANWMWQDRLLGSTPEGRALNPGTTDEVPGWSAAHRLSGHAAASLTMKFDVKGKRYANGEPLPGWVVQGNRVYDPRLDSSYPGGSGECRWGEPSRYVYSETPALHALMWRLGIYQNNKRIMGVGAPIDLIDLARIVESANIQEANGWKVGGELNSGMDRWEALKLIEQAGGAEPVANAAMMSTLQKMPRVAVGEITDADIVGRASIPGSRPRRERINGFRARFRSEAHGWEMVPIDLVQIADYVAADGVPRAGSADYALVQDKDQAAQLAAYEVYDSREIGPIELQVKPRFIGFRIGDALTANVTELGLVGQLVLIRGRRIDPRTGIVTLKLVTETAGKHAAALGMTGEAPPVPTLTYDPLDVPAPGEGDWTVEGGVVENDEGHTIPALIVTGAVTNSAADGVVFDFRKVGEADWTNSSIDAPDAVRKVITDVAPATDYEVGVRYKVAGVIGDRRELGSVVTGSDSTADTIDQVVNPGYLSGASKVALIANVDALEARYLDLHNAYLAVYSSAPGGGLPGDDPRVLLNADAGTARANLYAYLGSIPPDAAAWRDTAVASAIDHEALNDVLTTFEAALAAFDTGMKLGAPAGTLIDGVPATTVGQAVKLSLQNTGAIVAGGTLTPEAKTYIAKELAFFQERAADLTTRATPLGVSTASMAVDLAAFAAYVTGLPNWSNPAVPSAVNPTTYNNLAAAFRASSALLEGAISGKIAQGSRIATELVAGNGTITIVGDGASRSGVAAGYQTLYSNRSTKGDVTAKVRVRGDSVLPTVFGLSLKAGGGTASQASISYGFRVFLDGAGKRRVMKIVNGNDVGEWNGGQQFGASEDIWLSVASFEQGTGTRVMMQVSGRTEPVGGGSPGTEYVWKALLVGGSKIDNIVFENGNKIAYEAIEGPKPPVNATVGGNVVGEVEASGATGPDAEGFFTFTGDNAKIFLVGSSSAPMPWNGEPYANITVAAKSDTGVGAATVAMIFQTVTGDVARSIDARKGGAVAVPIGAFSYYAVQSSNFTSGSIKMQKAVITPRQEASVDNGQVPVATDTGVNAGGFTSYGPGAQGGAEADTGTYRFYPGDRLAMFAESVVTGDPTTAFGRTFGTKWLYVNFTKSAYVAATGTGSLALEIVGRLPNGSEATIASWDITPIYYVYDPQNPPPQSATINAWVELGAYSGVRSQIVASGGEGYRRTGLPTLELRNAKLTSQDVIKAIAPVNDPSAYGDTGPSYYTAYTPPGFAIDGGYSIIETKSLYAIGFTGADLNAKADVTTGVTWGTILAPPFAQGRTGVGQTVLVDGVRWSRSWDARYGQSGWNIFTTGAPGTPEAAGWVKAFSQAAAPKITEVANAAGTALLSEGEVSNAAVSLTASGELIGAGESEPLDALLLHNGAKEAGADVTATNVPIVRPLGPLTSSGELNDGVSPARLDISPFTVIANRAKGTSDVRPTSTWSASFSSQVTGSIVAGPSADGGALSVTSMVGVLGYATVTSVYDDAPQKDVVAVIKLIDPSTIYYLGDVYGAVTTFLSSANATAYSPITPEMTFEPSPSEQDFDGAAITAYVGFPAEDGGSYNNTTTPQMKLQTATRGSNSWSDVATAAPVGTSQAKNYIDSNGVRQIDAITLRLFTYTDSNYNDAVKIGHLRTNKYRLVARVSSASVRLGLPVGIVIASRYTPGASVVP